MKTTWNNFKIKGKFKGEKQSNLYPEFTKNKHHRVKVTNLDNGEEIKFDYWIGSGSGFEDETDLLEAFSCFVSDGLAAEQTLSEFAKEFGYNADVELAVKVYKECHKALKKVMRLFGDDRDKAYEIMNKLYEEV